MVFRPGGGEAERGVTYRTMSPAPVSRGRPEGCWTGWVIMSWGQGRVASLGFFRPKLPLSSAAKILS